MKRTLACGIVLMVCAAANADPIFTLTPSSPTAANGSSVTFTLNYNGNGLGLILARFDAYRTGTGTWTPTADCTLLAALRGHATSSPGTINVALPDCIDDVVLAVNYSSFPFDNTVGAASAVNIWTGTVTVHGTPGQTITMNLLTEPHPDFAPDANVVYSNSTYINTPTIIGTATVTIAAVPEPVTVGLFAVSAWGVALVRRRFRR